MLTVSPEGLSLSRASPTLQGWNSDLQPAGLLPGRLPPTPPSSQEREGPAWESPRRFRRGHAFEHTRIPTPPRPHIFTFGCFFFPFFLCQENQALAPAADLPPTLN